MPIFDADDIVNCSHISRVIQQCGSENLDVLAFNYNKISQEGSVLSDHTVFAETQILDGQSFVLKAFHNNITGHMGYDLCPSKGDRSVYRMTDTIRIDIFNQEYEKTLREGF